MCEVLILVVSSHVIEFKPFGLLLFLVMMDTDFFTDIQYPDIAQHLISETGINNSGCGMNTLWLICIVTSPWMHREMRNGAVCSATKTCET